MTFAGGGLWEASVLAEIQTQHFLNMCLGCYRYTNQGLAVITNTTSI
jgi:hypothetical protein